MAEKIIRLLTDDMETEEVEADAGTVEFGLDGDSYEIDLSKRNAAELRGELKRWIANARLVKGRAKAAPKTATGTLADYNSDQRVAIRHWARTNGYPDLSDKGKVPQEVVEKFELAHQGRGLFSAT